MIMDSQRLVRVVQCQQVINIIKQRYCFCPQRRETQSVVENKMAVDDWKRDTSSNFPSIWRRFTFQDNTNGGVRHFRIQDAEDNMEDAVIEHMQRWFLKEAVTCKATNICEDEVSVQEFEAIWRNMFKQKCTLVCLEEGPDGNLIQSGESPGPKIVGVNVLGISEKKNEAHINNKLKGKALSTMFGGMTWLADLVDVYDQYGVDKYMTALGLSVEPIYRGMGIGLQLLLARKELGNAIGVEVTSTIFTVVTSQKLATKAGFVTLVEKTFAEIENATGYHFPGISNLTVKIMARRLDED